MPIKTRQVTQYSAVCDGCSEEFHIAPDGYVKTWWNWRDGLSRELVSAGWQTEKHDRAYCEDCAPAREAA